MPNLDSREAVYGFFKRIYSTFDEKSGDEIINIFIQELGGLRVSIPDHGDLYRIERNKKIRAKFIGNNHKELALLFGLSAIQIRRILQNKDEFKLTGVSCCPV